MAVDRDRAEVYAAERMAFEGTDLEVVEPLEHLVRFAATIVDGGWWPAGPVSVRAARRDASSSSARNAGGRAPVVRLAAGQRTRATVVHELAHVLAGPGAGHGPRFRRAHVDVVAVAFGPERAGWLADAYAAAGLRLAARAWPAPPAEGPGHAIAL